ncbi:helix-turn-helix domain-containing protein [Nocardia vermiculata]|uniref:Helix-turn-helix domain-containing protein n=2 Tax=Nocardia vermiculata TaxID=257274 RepID=A0A846XVA0_9NOCA|nr:helix-turn-helix domain-containing protein [Nocardia vermiculata]
MLGRQLRHLRETSGVSVDTARKAIGVGHQTLWRLETGQSTRISGLQVRELCRIYRASDDVAEVLLELVGGLSYKSWWYPFREAVPKDFDLYLGLEIAASKFVSYAPTLLPGLVQTQPYRRAMTWAANPGMSTLDVETRIEIATRRQSRLREDPDLTVEIILSEAALRHRVGGGAVMAEQLRYLAEVTMQSNVSIRVVPFSATHVGLEVGLFVLLEFPEQRTAWMSEPPIVYVQGHTSDQYLERPEEIARYQDAVIRIGQSALDEKSTRDLVLTIAKEHDEQR